MLMHFQTKLTDKSFFQNGERILAFALLTEIVFFTLTAQSFFTWMNLFEVLRFSIELGLLSIALTPIMISGGIDLSVGSLVGLVAVVFGIAWQDGHLPISLAIILALLLGCVCGALNAL